MSDPRKGREGASGFSPKLGSRDPRLRSNQAGSVSDADVDGKTIQLQNGRQRVALFDGLPPLPAAATLSDVIAYLNAMRAKAL